MLREDNTGFVVFPNNGRIFDHIDSGKTMIYLVAFDPSDLSNQPYELSKNKITLPGNFVSDDVSFVKRKQPDFLLELDDFIKEHLKWTLICGSSKINYLSSKINYVVQN
jgi:hypothetical protein